MGLTSRWVWRCPPCLGWAAKETRLPARRPPLTKPWCRSAPSLRPHHHVTTTTTRTAITSSSLTLVASQPVKPPQHTTLVSYQARGSRGHQNTAVVHSHCPRLGLKATRSTEITPWYHHTRLYPTKKMATFATNNRVASLLHHGIL